MDFQNAFIVLSWTSLLRPPFSLLHPFRYFRRSYCSNRVKFESKTKIHAKRILEQHKNKNNFKQRTKLLSVLVLSNERTCCWYAVKCLSPPSNSFVSAWTFVPLEIVEWLAPFLWALLRQYSSKITLPSSIWAPSSPWARSLRLLLQA